MKKAYIILAVLIIGYISCKKKDSCSDPNALNQDSSGNCQYTKVIFYAPSNMIGGYGFKVIKIEVFRRILDEDQLIGTITDLNDQNPEPDGCTTPEKGIEYNFTQQDDALFVTRYYFENGVEDPGDFFQIATSSSAHCITQKLTI